MKKICSRLVCALLLVSLLCFAPLPGNASAVKVSCQEFSGSNQLSEYHSRWGAPVTSHLIAIGDGFMRFQAGAVDGYLAEYYDSAFNVLQTVTVATELPIYGGFFASGTHYYILSGQTNPEESADVECFRITKYDLNWTRLGSTGLYDCNTTVPFDAGSARFAVSGKYLLIRTAHEMYMSSDGYNHQANVTIQLDMETMTITDSMTYVLNSQYGYVSHSFDQFIQIENNRIVAVDHGDAHPRSIALLQYQTDVTGGTFTPGYYTRCTVTDLLTFPGSSGDNTTNASIGGFEISENAYLVAYNYVVNYDESADYATERSATRNVFIASMDKETGAVTNKQITAYADGSATASVPHLVKLSDSSFLLLWERGDDVYYTLLDAEGDPAGQIHSIKNAALSDCVPLVANGKATWYVWNDNQSTVYQIDLTDLSFEGTVDLQYGHSMQITSAPEAAGGNCTLECADCGYTQTGSTPSKLQLWWNVTGTYGTYYSAMPTTTFDVGDVLYFWDTTAELGAELDRRSITVSDPEGVTFKRTDDDMGYFTFKKTGTYTITVACDYSPLLTRTYHVTVAHTFENGVCTGCGAAEVTAPSFNVLSKTLNLEGEVKYNMIFMANNTASVKNMGLITFLSNPSDVSIDSADYVIPGAVSASGMYMVGSQGIPAKNLGDTLYMVIYAKLTDGSYAYSGVVPYSAKEYAYAQLNNSGITENQRKLLVAMLNYGAEAQLAFGYNTDDLINADLAAMEIPEMVTYSNDLLDGCVSADDAKIGNFPTGGFHMNSATVSLEGALAINYLLMPANTPANGMKVYYWTAETYNSVDVLSIDNADGTLDSIVSSGMYMATYNGLAASQMGDTVYVAAVYENGGNTYTSGVISYSLAKYLTATADGTGEQKNLAAATVIYGYYANIEFPNV